MTTAVEHNDQTRRLITFLCRFFLQNFHQNFTNIEQKRCKKQSINIFLLFIEVWTQWVLCNVNVRARDPLRSYFDEQLNNEIYFLIAHIIFFFQYPRCSSVKQYSDLKAAGDSSWKFSTERSWAGSACCCQTRYTKYRNDPKCLNWQVWANNLLMVTLKILGQLQ